MKTTTQSPKAVERTQTDREFHYDHLRDDLRDMAIRDSAHETELHRMADRIDGILRINRFGHHVACGTAFGRACDCNGHVSEGGTAPYEAR